MNIQSKLGFTPIRWDDNGLIILDQRLLPIKEQYRRLSSVAEVSNAIKDLSVRGAPLIGIAAAYGLCLVRDPHNDNEFQSSCEMLKHCRPTAANLAWAVERMAKIQDSDTANNNLREILLNEARLIHSEDAIMCERIGVNGNSLIPQSCRILTHCNTGALATGGTGTALGIVYTAFWSGKNIHVWVDETRPVLQGSRLTAWELSKAKIPYTLICDNMAASLMAKGEVDIVITGADRIAANGAVANKIGTYNLAVLCKYHKIPFYVAAPSSTIDFDCHDGNSIVIEERPPDEIKSIHGYQIAPYDAGVFNPAFDVTPHDLVTAIITEKSNGKRLP